VRVLERGLGGAKAVACRRVPIVVVLLGVLGFPNLAGAALGDDETSIHADQVRVLGVRRQAAAVGMTIHTITTPDGSTIRQYVSPSGRVFAVAWNTRYKPRLDLLLGASFPTYAEAGRLAMQKRPGVVHSAVVRRDDLVVESTAHLSAHVGRAYLKSLLPAGASTDALR
jgi:hypothetical protein